MVTAPAIDDIIALDDKPVLRNLLITQTYHDLSAGLAQRIGRDNVNWCHFAARASKTAGRFIRRDEVPVLFRRLLADSHEFGQKCARLLHAVHAIDSTNALEHEHLLGLADAVVKDVSDSIIAGNLKVFAELGPVFSRLMDSLGEAGSVDQVKLDALLGSLKAGPTVDGGQSLLRAALEHFVEAHRETDPVRRAQSMLLANAQTGLHEQIRLQPFIARAIDAPIDEVFHRLHEIDGRFASDSRIMAAIHATFDRLTTGLQADVRKVWEIVSTRELMTLSMPDEMLRLGAVLPPPKGEPLFPVVLQRIDLPDLIDLLHQFGAFEVIRTEATVRDWAHLDERMRYIVQLFRSRQQTASLFMPPFDNLQREALLAGVVPVGPL